MAGNFPVDLREVRDLGQGSILIHQTQPDPVAIGFIDIFYHSFGVLNMTGQQKMPDNDAGGHHTGVIIAGFGLLPDHLSQGCPGNLRIIRRPGVPLRRFGLHVFEIGEVDVHNSLQAAEGLHALIAAAVVDNGDGEPLCPGEGYRLDDLRGIVGGGDQVDVGSLLLLELQEDLRQAFH